MKKITKVIALAFALAVTAGLSTIAAAGGGQGTVCDVMSRCLTNEF